MNKLIRLTLFLTIVISVVASCSSEDEVNRSREEKITAMFNGTDQAFAMFSLNLDQLIQKSGVNDGVLPVQFQFLMDQVLQYIKDDNMTGVDITTKIHAFVDTDGTDEPEYFVASIMVKNKEAFQAFVEKELDFKIISDEDAEMPVAQSRDKQLLASWNEDGFGLFVSANSKKAADNGEKYLEKMWELQTSADVSDKVLKYLENEADISFFSKGNKTTEFIEVQAAASNDKEAEDLIKKMEKYSDNSYTSAYITFNNGNVTVRNEIDWNEEFLKDYPYLKESGVDQKIMNYLSKDGNAIAAGNIALNMDALWSFFDFIVPADVKDEMNSEMQGAGVAMEMLKSSISGDIAYALTGFNFPQNEEGMYNQSNDEIYFSVAFSTKNSAVIKEIMAQAPDMNGEDGFYTVDQMNYVVMDDYFVVTSDSLLALNIKNGSTTPLDMGELNKDLSAQLINGVIDFNTLNESLKNLPGNDEISKVTELFDHATFNADMNSSEVILYFKDKEKNALRIVTSIATESASQMMM